MDQDYFATSDMAFASYLMVHDFTAITCVDPEDGQGRYDFYLTHSDPEIRDNIFVYVNKLRDKFNSEDASYSEFYRHTRKLRGLTRTPVRKSEYER